MCRRRAERPAVAAKMKERVVEVLRSGPTVDLTGREGEGDAELRAALEQLGYADDAD